MVTPNADAARRDFAFQMPIAQMVRQPRGVQGVFAAHFQKLFGSSQNFDQAAIFKHIAITPAQGRSVRQINQKLDPTHGLEDPPAAATFFLVKHNGIGDRTVKMAGFCGENHSRCLSNFGRVQTTRYS